MIETKVQEQVNNGLFSNNEWRPAYSGKAFEVVNPANGQVIGNAAQGAREDAVEAIQAASRSFPSWSQTTGDERAKLLNKAGELVAARRDQLARVLTLEQGKPFRDAQKEVQASADTLIYYAEEARRIGGEVAPSKARNARSLVLRQPVGVVAAISPWNYPMSLMAWKVGPALAAGCTLIAKPPSITPLATGLFVAACAEAGLPPGVVNVITGPSSIVGEELITHPLVQMVAFTGSTEIGKHLMESASRGLKKLCLELGGHTPFVVFKDADFDRAVKDAVKRSFRNMGQICNAVNRIYVEQPIAAKFIERFVEEAKKMTIGDGLANPDVDLGPMVDAEGIARTERHIQDALAKGATLLCGGKRPARADLAHGNFYEPTAVTNVTGDMLVMHEETFGPLVGIATFEGLDEALRLANSTDYGLVTYCYTNDISTMWKFAERMESGTVAFNTVSPDSLYAPYPAWKQSGLGVELAHFGIDEYLRVKHVLVEFKA
jgi:succinate-semialdehyde dehydrogenase / glutarate-semialdehyde dehydrogenase